MTTRRRARGTKRSKREWMRNRETVGDGQGRYLHILRSQRKGLEFKSLLIAKQLLPDLLVPFLWSMSSSANNADGTMEII